MLYLIKTLFVIDSLMMIGLLLFRWALAPRYRDIVSAKVAIVALFTPVVALFCGDIYLFCGYLAAVVAFNSRSRAELASNYLFLLPLVPYLAIDTRIGGIYLLGVSTVMAMSFGALIGFAITRTRRPLALPRYDLAIFILVVLFTFIYNKDLSVTILLRGLTINVLGFLAPYLLISRSMRSAEDIERLLLRLCLGGTLMAVTAIFQAGRHWILFQAYYETLHVPFLSLTLALRAGLMRTGGSMLDYSAGGLFLAVMLTLMPFLRSRFRSAGFWAVLITLIGGLVAAQSRGAWVAAIGGILFVLAYRGQWGKVALLAGGAVAAEVMILLFASGRLAGILGQTQEAGGTVSYRQLLALRGMDQIRNHPLFGQSPDQLVANLPDLVQGQHIVDFVNAHLFIAMAAGIPLFVLWCGIWLMPVIEGWRNRRMSGNLMEIPAAIIIPAMIALMFTSISDRNLIWPTIALGIAGPCLNLARWRRDVRGLNAVRLEPSLAYSGSKSWKMFK